jgi:hypothetical protein
VTRIIIEKSGIRTDVPENEVVNYYRLGYVKVGELPDALPEKEQPLTSEQQAVNDAVLELSKAQLALSEAEKANDKSQVAGSPVPGVEPAVYPESVVYPEPITYPAPVENPQPFQPIE